MTHMVHCKKLEGLEKPPFPGELGQKIYDEISKEAWENWYRLQTQIINEYRLSLLESESRDLVLKHMQNYLFATKKPEETDEKA